MSADNNVEFAKMKRRDIGQCRRAAVGGGARGLLASVVAMATVDALSRDRHNRLDALSYFAGPIYHHHLSLLGFPVDWLPEGVVLRPTQ